MTVTDRSAAPSVTPTVGSGASAPRAVPALVPRPRRGEVRVRVAAVGMSALGLQAAARVQAIGPEAVGFAIGDRVSYRLPTRSPIGITSVVSERDLIGIPRAVSFDQAASLLPFGLVARTIVKQLHSIGAGNTVTIAHDNAGVDAFVRAWASDLGAIVVEAGDGRSERSADITITADDYRSARQYRYAAGFAQQASADVFQAVRRGVFDGLEIASYPMTDAAKARFDLSHGPVVLLPVAA